MNSLMLAVCLLARVLHFQTDAWDFGVMEEKEGPQWHTFVCENTSKKPIAITQVASSCRCVSADYSREEIAPGASFEINVKLDPAGLGGPVSRTLTVYAGGEHHILTLKADVVPAEEGELRYRLAPALRAESREVRFGNVPRGGSRSLLLRVKNVSSTQVPLASVFSSARALLDIECPESLGPGQDTDVLLTFRAAADAPYGRVEAGFGELKASAVVTDDFSAGGKVPRMRLLPSEFRLKRGKGSIKICNDGAANLIIRAVEADCRIDIKAGDRIAPGKERLITVRTDVPGSIFIVTNDPQRPYRELRINPAR